jgi:thiamine transport system permease protein
LALLVVFVFIPLVLFIVQALFSFDTTALSPVYLQLLLRAFFAGSLQALISASLVCFFSSTLALMLLKNSKSNIRLRLSSLKIIGVLYFVMPGTALALIFYNLPWGFSEILRGWPLIVLAHVCWSLLFVSESLYQRLHAWMEAEGFDLLRVAQTLGASAWSSTWHVVFPFFKTELRSTFALVFVWSLGAFSTVLLLGLGPQHSTPEVLLFYTLLNDMNSSRLLILLVLTLALQSFVIRKTYLKYIPLRLSVPDSDVQNKDSPATGIPHFSRHIPFFVSALFAFFLVLHLKGIFVSERPPELFAALKNSLAYSFMSSSIALFFCLLLALASPQARRICLLAFALSPVILASLWTSLLAPYLDTSDFLSSVSVASLGLALLLLPLMALWIDGALSSLHRDYRIYSQSLGLNLWQHFTSIELPLLKPFFERIVIYSFCIALGDLALSSLFLREFDLLPLMARRLTQSFNFGASSWVLFTTLGAALSLSLLFQVFKFFKKRGATI